MAVREGFRSTTGGLRDCFPLRLYQKAKRLGGWDPAAIDFTEDSRDWAAFGELERETILSLTSLFAAGEEAVTLDLLPLVLAIAREGRIEEELYLTTFLFEEAKHTELFARFLVDVADSPSELERFHVPSYRTAAQGLGGWTTCCGIFFLYPGFAHVADEAHFGPELFS